uniref:Uncharacterized protein n=1 Tax=Arundo donax TaxID=35708 RepID=A0A0A9GRN5_ARUDO
MCLQAPKTEPYYMQFQSPTINPVELKLTIWSTELLGTSS